jgi:CheY-like chemotaxis protein
LHPELGRIPAIALGSSNTEEEIEASLRAGFHIHAVKPIAADDLVAMVCGVAAHT